jgi:hypothetical protein
LGYRHQNDKLKAYLQIRIGLAWDIPKHQFVFTSQQTVNHMKNYLLPLLLLYTCTCYSQSIKSTEITRKESVKFAESIGSFETFEGRQLWAKLFKSSNGSGSAHTPGTDEVSFSIFICLAHYDDEPESKLYKVGPFTNPKVIKKVDSGNSITFYVKDVTGSNTKIYKLVGTETGLKIVK